MTPKPQGADFGLEVNFSPGSDAPSRVFRAMTDLIEAFESVDRSLVRSVARIEPVMLLENVETGSIRAWLRTQLEAVDDQTLKTGEWKRVLGIYLVKAKYFMIDFLHDRSTITSKAEIENLQAGLLRLAAETDVLAIPTYSPLTIGTVADSVRRISEATHPLRASDSARFLSEVGNAEFNLGFSVTPESFDELISREAIKSTTTMILKVKKPDYLGESMWEFRFGNQGIEAKFLDFEWLKKFREGSVLLRPGDAIKAVVDTEVKYSYEGEVLSTSHRVVSVIEVISVQSGPQQKLFRED